MFTGVAALSTPPTVWVTLILSPVTNCGPPETLLFKPKSSGNDHWPFCATWVCLAVLPLLLRLMIAPGLPVPEMVVSVEATVGTVIVSFV